MVAAAVVMISPEAFGANPQTAASNAFQHDDAQPGDSRRVREEFSQLQAELRAAGVQVHHFPGRSEPELPDQVFPNNWFSTHPDGTVVLYPLLASNRRTERRADVIDTLERSYRVSRILDLSGAELEGRFLEGTGSVVIDHHNGAAFAALSARTDLSLARMLGQELGLEMVTFATRDGSGRPFYHTNVVMSIAADFAIWCPDAVPDRRERQRVNERLATGGREVIAISLAQTGRFAANLLALGGDRGPVIAVSSTAIAALDADQALRLADYGRLVSVPVPTVERLGGGSVRCMLAEVYLPARERRPAHV